MSFCGKHGKIYCELCIKSAGEQVSMVMKPRTLGLLGYSEEDSHKMTDPAPGDSP